MQVMRLAEKGGSRPVPVCNQILERVACAAACMRTVGHEKDAADAFDHRERRKRQRDSRLPALIDFGRTNEPDELHHPYGAEHSQHHQILRGVVFCGSGGDDNLRSVSDGRHLSLVLRVG